MVKLTITCDVCGETEETCEYSVTAARKACQFEARLTPLGWKFHWYDKKITCPRCELPGVSTEGRF